MAKIDWTKPVVDADGRPVKVLCTDLPGRYPVLVELHDKDGSYCDTVNDTFGYANSPPEPITVYRYVNVYPNGPSSIDHESPGEADRCATWSRIARVKVAITYREGQFDE